MGPTHCEVCGTEYEVARFKDLPYAVAAILAMAFAFAGFSGLLDSTLFLILCGLWLVFDFIWETLVPLKPVGNSSTDESSPM